MADRSFRALALALVLAASAPAGAADRTTSRQRDEFYWLGEFNKASTVMVAERGIVPRPLGATIARAVAQVIADGEQPGAKRPADYLQVEPLITAIAGPDATRMHSGRSRQDILATTRRVMLRDRLLELLAGIVTTMALTVGALTQDIHTQYHESKPWLMLQEGALTGPSSIMPQKRNPYGLNLLCLQASDAIGIAETYVIDSHNVPPGMPDYKRDASPRALAAAAEMFARLTRVLDGMVVLKERALAEVEGDYSTTTELADTLQREADVPFRVGHHFASDLVTYGRSHDLTAAQIPFAEAQRIYTEAARAFGIEGAQLPLSEAQSRRSLSARGMVEASKGLGGPQPAEVARILAEEQARLAADQGWVAERRTKLREASARLDEAFNALASAQ